ncbi:MAG TPA: Fe-S cluster assembly protein SufD [bacterium]|nr:Fe-S cluster assembly protein SufD [bacterium]HPR86697.1 Fe-S cluster assembly protein SufD [bacterium]
MKEKVSIVWPEAHYRLRQETGAAAPELLQEVRREAWARFVAQGFPTLKQERWRFTDVSALAESDWCQALEFAGPDRLPVGEAALLDPSAYRLVFINGRFSPQESRLPDGAESFTLHLSSALHNGMLERAGERMRETMAQSETPFALLNAALAEESVVVTIPDRLSLLVPLEIVHHVDTPDPAVVHPRVVVFMGDRSEAQLTEIYSGGADSHHFTNPVVDVVIGAESRLTHYVVQRESPAAHHISYTRATLGRASQYGRFAFDFGGRLVRHDLTVELAGQEAEATLHGLYMPEGRQHIDHHTTLRHLQPHTYSRQLYKGILQDKAHAVFNGRIFVAREAQRTDAIQHNKNLLLSDEALADSQPQLEIFADDVRCTHGGAIGQMDQEGLFYLQSRGIGAALARQIMVHAFAGEISAAIRSEFLRTQIEQLVHERLGSEE